MTYNNYSPAWKRRGRRGDMGDDAETYRMAREYCEETNRLRADVKTLTAKLQEAEDEIIRLKEEKVDEWIIISNDLNLKLQEAEELLKKALSPVAVAIHHGATDWRIFFQKIEAFLNPTTPPPAQEYVPKTPLGKKMLDLRNAAIAKGMMLLSAEEITGEGMDGEMDNYATKIAEAMLKESVRAGTKFPPFNSTHEGYAVILEELDELWDEVKRTGGARHSELLKEAIQVGAMALRFVHDLIKENYFDGNY